MAIAGDAAATDPACVKSPIHARMATLTDAAHAEAAPEGNESFIFRRIGSPQRDPTRALEPARR
jgi:pyrroloquinoline quinone biosynthesis protein E